MILSFVDTLSFAFSITGPIFIVVLTGLLLKKIELISDQFVESSSKLVFFLALPAYMFIVIVQAELEAIINIQLIVLMLLITQLVFFIAVVTARHMVNKPQDRGVFVQGIYRGNIGIVGLAMCVNAYGDQGLAVVSLIMALMTVQYNILAVYILNRTILSAGQVDAANVFYGVAKNPIIISITLALIVKALAVPVPNLVLQTGELFSQMTLPLALMCIGASLSLKGFQSDDSIALWATFFKLVAVPLLTMIIAVALGYRGIELGVVFFMSSAPTAAASFVMVRALNGNGPLAANIVVFSTLFSLLTISFGLALLRGFNLI